MKATILFGIKKTDSILKKIEKKRTLFLAHSRKLAYLYHIENPEVDSYIIYPEGLSPNSLQTMIEHIHYLNALITIIIIKKDLKFDLLPVNNKNIKILTNEDDIPHILKNIPLSQRDANRVNWPLNVEYKKNDSLKVNNFSGIVLSISSSGCFIKINNNSIKTGEKISMTFQFKDFDFYSTCSVIRLKMKEENILEGIAVKFSDVSQQTQKCIKKIINEKILFELMNTLKPEYNE